MNKRAAAPILIIAILLALVIGGGAILKTAGFGDFERVYKKNYGHICCEEGAFEPPYIRKASDEPKYKCDAYTDECRIRFKYYEKPWYLGSGANICWKKNGIQQRAISWGSDTQLIINYGEEIEFISCGYNQDARDYYEYIADYRKFYIQGEENGKIYTRNSCILDSDLKKRVLSQGLNELSKTGSNRCQNYMVDFIVVATRTYNYRGQEVICQARAVYEINQEKFKDGSIRKIQGNKIANVECCPSEPNCDEDFKFKTNIKKECIDDSECANAGEPILITGTSYVEWSCINGQCVKGEERTVECTVNAVCVDKLNKPNAVCKNFKCVEDDKWLGHCGNGKCESILGETPTSCPNDCGEYQKSQEITWWMWLIIIIGGAIAFRILWPIIYSWLIAIKSFFMRV